MRLFGYMVTHNEMGRYLEECLEEWLPCLDSLAIYDDQSTDETTRWLINHLTRRDITTSWAIGGRPTEAFSFIEDESAFREDAWKYLEQTFSPREGDWIMSLDADEIIRYPYPEYVKEFLQHIDRLGHDALRLHIHEVWTSIGEPPMIRTDGFWAETYGIRACKWQPGGKFKDQKMGGGSLPDYVHMPFKTTEIDLLHYGYARQEDREAKYQRYRSKSGHNPRHISSILKRPTLAPLPPLGIEL